MLSNPLNHGVPNMNGGRPGKGFELVWSCSIAIYRMATECYTDPEGERRVVSLCTNTYILCPAKTWTRLWFDDWWFGGEPYLLRRSTPNVSSTILKVAWGRSFRGQQKARGRTGEVIGWIRSVKPYSGVVDVGETYPAVIIRNIWMMPWGKNEFCRRTGRLKSSRCCHRIYLCVQQPISKWLGPMERATSARRSVSGRVTGSRCTGWIKWNKTYWWRHIVVVKSWCVREGNLCWKWTMKKTASSHPHPKILWGTVLFFWDGIASLQKRFLVVTHLFGHG